MQNSLISLLVELSSMMDAAAGRQICYDHHRDLCWIQWSLVGAVVVATVRADAGLRRGSRWGCCCWRRACTVVLLRCCCRSSSAAAACHYAIIIRWCIWSPRRRLLLLPPW